MPNSPADRALAELDVANRAADRAAVKVERLTGELIAAREALTAAIKRRDYAAANPALPGVLPKHDGPSADLHAAEPETTDEEIATAIDEAELAVAAEQTAPAPVAVDVPWESDTAGELRAVPHP
jgi:hypothetical protein